MCSLIISCGIYVLKYFLFLIVKLRLFFSHFNCRGSHQHFLSWDETWSLLAMHPLSNWGSLFTLPGSQLCWLGLWFSLSPCSCVPAALSASLWRKKYFLLIKVLKALDGKCRLSRWCCAFLWDSFSCHSSGWHGTHYIAHGGLKADNCLVSASQRVWLLVCASTPSLNCFLTC